MKITPVNAIIAVVVAYVLYTYFSRENMSTTKKVDIVYGVLAAVVVIGFLIYMLG